MRKISIDPITRLEGHGKIEIFVNDAGEVANVYFQVPELRGFERFCVGPAGRGAGRASRRASAACAPRRTTWPSTKAIDGVFGVEPPPAGAASCASCSTTRSSPATTRRTSSCSPAPTSSSGRRADPAERNILGVIAKVGLEIGGEVIKMRAEAHELVSIIGGKAIHPVCGLPGGVSKAITPEERDRPSRSPRARSSSPGLAADLRRRGAGQPSLRRPHQQ